VTAFLEELEKAVRDILQREVSTAEKLRALEMGAKLLMIRHRIEGAGEGEDGKFFSKTG
jgi:hypothetical protein